MAKARPCSHIKTQDKASKALNPESLAKRKEPPKWELHHHGSTFIHPPCWPTKSRLFKLHVTFQPRSTSPSAREGSGLYHILRCAGVVSWCATDTLNIFTSFDHGIHPPQGRRHRVPLWYETARHTEVLIQKLSQTHALHQKKGTTTDLPTNPLFQDSQGVKYPNLQDIFKFFCQLPQLFATLLLPTCRYQRLHLLMYHRCTGTLGGSVQLHRQGTAGRGRLIHQGA